MKKYDVALALALTKDTGKLALARIILDMMELNELYTELDYDGSFEDIKKMKDEDIFKILGIEYEERGEKLEGEPKEKNYDVALALATAGKVEEARRVLEMVNAKKELAITDFRDLDREEREKALEIQNIRDLHKRLFIWLKEKNLPQQEVPREDKYYFREVAVGWKVLDMEFNLKEELDTGEMLEKLDDNTLKQKFKKQVELNLIDRDLFNKIIKRELSTDYGFQRPNLLKFIDYVCVVGNTAWIIEGKERLNFKSIGQVNVCSHLFSKDYPQFSVRKAVVCEESDPLIEDYCEKFDITVFRAREEK